MSLHGPKLPRRLSAFVSAIEGLAAAPAVLSARQLMTQLAEVARSGQKMMWVLGQAVRLVSAMISSGRTSTAPPATSLVFSVYREKNARA